MSPPRGPLVTSRQHHTIAPLLRKEKRNDVDAAGHVMKRLS
jgi:hypothetical protein